MADSRVVTVRGLKTGRTFYPGMTWRIHPTEDTPRV